MLFAATPPANLKHPPAYRFVRDTASAYTAAYTTVPSMPEPTADQLFPSHLAIILLPGAPPAVGKGYPPTYTSLPNTAIAVISPSIPGPSTSRLLPFHFARAAYRLPP